MANQWFKFYGGEYLSDPKIERLTPTERSCWVTLLCLASMNGSGEIEYLTVESLLNKSGIQFDPYHPEDWEKSLGVLTKFQNMKMLKLDSNGTISILNWKKRQEHAMTVAERQAKYRENRKSNEKVTARVTKVTTEEKRIEENREDITSGAKDGAESEKPKHNPLGAEVIKAFEAVDPKNKKYYGNKTQRAACDFLIEEYGLEEVLKRIPYLIQTNKIQYFPTITTPVHLRDKWVQLQDAVQRKRGELKANQPKWQIWA